MKKKLASMSTIALLSVGVVAVLTLSNPEIRSQTIFATARDKQLAWLNGIPPSGNRPVTE